MMARKNLAAGLSEGIFAARRPNISGRTLMVVSFHPLFKADQNILCAGRDPGPADLAAIREAAAVILPQGCPRRLYDMARNNCPHIFPNYDVRFRYPGKIGQIKLFLEASLPHPATETFLSTAEFWRCYPDASSPQLPLVFKFDWGGEGDTVFLVQSANELEELLQHTARCEASGQSGFMLQKYIPSGNRSLRVAIIGDSTISYWRIREEPGFHASLSKGAKIDTQADPELKEIAETIVADFCRRVGINLAGLDVIFDPNQSSPQPLVLEINYFFGRVGLGGSEEYYRLLKKAIRRWLKTSGIYQERFQRSFS
jgi:ribosomal protein S6--L-glutamate ligase